MQETGATIPTETFESRIKTSKTWPVFPKPDGRSLTHCYIPRAFYSPKCSISGQSVIVACFHCPLELTWFQLPWPEGIPITAKELHPLSSQQCCGVTFGTDNGFNLSAIIWQLWLVSHLDHPGIYCYAPLMILWLISAHYQFDAFPIHIPRQKIVAADALSRNH